MGEIAEAVVAPGAVVAKAGRLAVSRVASYLLQRGYDLGSAQVVLARQPRVFDWEERLTAAAVSLDRLIDAWDEAFDAGAPASLARRACRASGTGAVVRSTAISRTVQERGRRGCADSPDGPPSSCVESPPRTHFA